MDYQYFACIEALRIAQQELNVDYWKSCPERYMDLEEPSSLQLYFEYLELAASLEKCSIFPWCS